MTGQELYNIAKKHKGEGGSKFRKYCGLPSGSAYCNAYVCYIANEGGVKSLYFDGTKQTYCPTSIKWCRSNLAEIPLFLAMPMDIIYFDWNANRVPDHIGFVKQRKDTSSIYTHEGNTSGGIVAEKTRTAGYVLGVFRPHFKGSYDISKPLTVDGQFDYSSVAMLQKALGLKVDGILGKDTVKALQKKAGVTPDGCWGKNTSKAVQKMVGVTADGAFGINSVKALQKWINKNVQFKSDGKTTEAVKKEETPTPSVPLPSKYDGELPTLPIKVSTERGKELAAKARTLAWAIGTPEKKYKYSSGAPTSKCKTAMKKRGYNSKVSFSDCGYFQNSVIYAVLGTKVKVLGAVKKAFPSVKGFKIVHKGKIGSGVLEVGDIIRYKKKSGQHVVMYVGDGIIAEAGRKTRFGRMIKSKKYNADNVKLSSIQVLRVVEGTTTKDRLAKGDTGSEVKKWQKFLKWYGYDCSVDGDFGEKTVGFTKTFQLNNGLTADGEVGKTTIAKAKEVVK